MISHFSVLSAIASYSGVLCIVCVLRRRTELLERVGASVLLLASSFASVRLLLPFELPQSFLIRSWDVLGPLPRLARAYPAVGRFLVVCWAVGASVAMVAEVALFFYHRKLSREYVTVEDESVQRIARRLGVGCPVVVSPDVEMAYVAGVFRLTVYFPAMEASEEEIELILAHEAEHVRAHDAVVKLFFGILTVALWWNPLVHLWREDIDALIEMRCDEKVIEHMDEEEQFRYTVMLKDMAERIVNRRRTPAMTLDESMAARGGCALSQRVTVINDRKGAPPKRASLAAFCFMLVLFVASYSVLFQPASAPPESHFKDEPEIYYKENYDGSEIDDWVSNAFILKEPDGRYRLIENYKFSKYLTEDEVASEKYRQFYIFEEGDLE